jgi:hypothetical protein
MALSGSLASVLEDSFSQSAAVIGDVANYYWPVWRYGQILRPAGGESLQVSDAKKIGALFEPGRPAVVRYLGERTAELRKDIAHLGGKHWREWPQHLRYGSKPFQDLEDTWQPEKAVITYSFVPIIRLPRFVVEIGGASWQARESLTVCGEPANSKAWVTASLIAYNGKPTDSVPLDRDEIGDAWRHLEAFARASLASLIQYYRQVLNEDTAGLPLEKRVRFGGFEVLTETEIVSVASRIHLERAFDLLEKTGVRRFRRDAPESPENRVVLDFLDWTESGSSFGPGAWEAGKAKILAIYAEEPACGSVRTLVIPRLDHDRNRTGYALLSERLHPEKPVTCYPLSEAAGRFLAMEYGRYF